MKILLPHDIFPGGFLTSMGESFRGLGFEVVNCEKPTRKFTSRVLNRIDHFGILGLKKKILSERKDDFNNHLIELAKREKVEVFFGIGGGGYRPDTIKKLKDLGVYTITVVSDNPCDPARDKYYAMSLRYYDVILYTEKIWMKILNNLAPKAAKVKFHGGYEPNNFFPPTEKELNQVNKSELTHDVIFTGSSYKDTAEGSYRAGILGQLAEDNYDVHIWGDEGWKYREEFYPALKNRIQTKRLPYNELRALISCSKIYINMPSPQIFTTFQPRVFEIAATKGFQIIDHSDELDDIFGNDYVSFKNYDDLKEKIDYYLINHEERKRITEKMYEKVVNNFSWESQISKLFGEIGLTPK